MEYEKDTSAYLIIDFNIIYGPLKYFLVRYKMKVLGIFAAQLRTHLLCSVTYYHRRHLEHFL
jgi:hypothetical protein